MDSLLIKVNLERGLYLTPALIQLIEHHVSNLPANNINSQMIKATVKQDELGQHLLVLGNEKHILHTLTSTSHSQEQETPIGGIENSEQDILTAKDSMKFRVSNRSLANAGRAQVQKVCTWECPFCGQMTRNKYQHKLHVKLRYWCSTSRKELCLQKGKKKGFKKIEIKGNTSNCCGILPQRIKKTSLRHYKCKTCGKNFKYKILLKKHNQFIVCSAFGKKCSLCGTVFENRTLMLMHQRTDHKGDCTYACCLCEKKFFTKCGLSSHIKHYHNKDKSYLCTKCGKTFCKVGGLHYHKKVHIEEDIMGVYKMLQESYGLDKTEKFTCFVCEKLLSKPLDWFYHIGKHRETDNNVKFKCEAQLSDLLDTNRDAFDRIAHPCKICHRVLFKKKVLNEHLNSHNASGDPDKCKTLRKYQCEFCSCCFVREETLERHQQQHTGNFKFCCEICGARFSMEKHLHVHKYESHQVQHKSLFVCALCKTLCPGKSRLADHMRAVHNHIKPFHCVQCGKAFATKYSRNVHERYHTNERPYSCPVCINKTFVDRSNLLAHCHKKHPDANVMSDKRTKFPKP